VGSPDFNVLDSVLEPVTSVELPKEVFTSRARWMPLIIEWNASTKIFYLLKNLLLLILVIFKLKCNNLILNEIRVLNASYMCLHAFSLHQESLNPDPGRRTPYFWGGSITITNWSHSTFKRNNREGLVVFLWDCVTTLTVIIAIDSLRKQINVTSFGIQHQQKYLFHKCYDWFMIIEVKILLSPAFDAIFIYHQWRVSFKII
jgi:hypothetical protein